MAQTDPGHKVEVFEGTEHVTVSIDGTIVADSHRPLLVHETGLPVRYYLPPDDVDLAKFRPTETHTTCPFKGEASYWTYTGGGATREDVVWGYPDPLPAVAPIKDHLSFYDTIAEIKVHPA